MRYVTEYEICALLFLIVITVRFFCMRKFHNRANDLFGLILHCAVVILTLDILGSYFVLYANDVAPWLNYAVNTIFYILQLSITGILLVYVLTLCGKDKPLHTFIMLIPMLVIELVVLSNSFTKLIFYFEKTPQGLVFTHGNLFLAMYLLGALYILFTLFIVLRYRRRFRKTEIRTIIMFILIIVTALVLQYVFPHVLLTGVAMAVAIFMMFLTLQNPETMLDSITGTFNYTALIDYLRMQIAEQQAIRIIAVDVGGIRRVNSLMGIRAGNELLEQVGEFINATCKNHATAFRLFGTRFIVISDSYRAHSNITERITERFKQTWSCDGGSIILLATIRHCEQKNKFSSPEDVISLIDLAYSKISRGGFGTTMPIDAEQLEVFRRNAQIKDALARAISTGEGFSLHYQPLYSVKEKKFCGAEALLRFTDPVLGPISPAEFIPIAETTDLIFQIDCMVVKMACDFYKAHPELSKAGLNLLEINLSATEFNSDAEKIYSEITANIESIENKICFEVTETALTTRREVLSDFMHRLIQKGVKFAIDDFGAGYANITQLAKLPFTVVKLDRVFISQNSPKEASILKGLVNMFKNIGLITVIEGIETEQQAGFAAELGVGQIQGYYYSHPLPEDDFIRLMTAQADA